MVATFEYCIDIILKYEGGYSFNKYDLGGETSFGITKRSYPNLDIKSLTKVQAIGIYKHDFWEKYELDTYPNVIRLQLFDCFVNMGPRGAIKTLQTTLNRFGANLVVDGSIGPATYSALNNACLGEGTQKVLPHLFAVDRLLYYIHLAVSKPSQLIFLNGWSLRTNNVLNESLK